jgi:3,4-dihydroxyphenylacetate 2,3-dioxygenase
MHKVWDPFLEVVDRRVVELSENGEWAKFRSVLKMYNETCFGESGMHDTTLTGAMGGEKYTGKAQVVTPYFGCSDTGQINAILPVTPVEDL